MISRPTPLTLHAYEQMACDGEFDGLEDRVELIRGELHYMNPAGPYHGDIVFYLTEWTVREGRQYGYSAWPQQGIRLEEVVSIPEPDVAWVRLRRYKRKLPTRDDVGLVIEVAHSSLDYDRSEKALLYAEAGIPEYWIANCEDQCVEVHRRPLASGYTEHFVVASGETVSPLSAPLAVLDVADLFADE